MATFAVVKVLAGAVAPAMLGGWAIGASLAPDVGRARLASPVDAVAASDGQ
jgi:hypothetical protein